MHVSCQIVNANALGCQIGNGGVGSHSMAKRPRLLTTLRRTFAAFRDHNASRFGAALAFYIVFTIAPMLLIAIAVAGSLFGRVWAERAILDRIGGRFGSAAGRAVAAVIKSAARSEEHTSELQSRFGI